MQSIDAPDRQWWQRPPGRPMTFTAIALVLVLAWAVSLPGGNFMLLLVAFWPTAIFALVWVIRVGVALATPHRPRWDARYLVIPVICLTGLVAAAFDLPREARWAYAKPRMESASAAIRSGAMKVAQSEDLRIGSYALSFHDRQDGNVWFRITDAGFLNSTYLVHSPENRPVHAQGRPTYNTVEHFDGQWWLVNEIFD
ncbi:hypothetical protein GCM10009551_097610 [Nocardiopsis tropica]|uniref:hypothetical protein n=1 Tax=Tsukamurella strandjordii TaxID=147577 RepID=UPI0031D8A2B3